MHFGHKFWCSEIAIQKCVLTQSHFRCILDISFGALPTKCVLSHSHFRGILELNDLTAAKFSSAEKLSSID